MITNNQNTSLNFGWNGVTHQALTQKAANKINKLNRNNKDAFKFNTMKLVEASTLPDKIHKDTPHIADVDNLEGINGYSLFKNFHHKAIEAFKNEDLSNFETNVGKAIHYLQDIINPYHVSAKKMKQKQIAMINHKHFEDRAEQFQHNAIQEARLEHQKSDLGLEEFVKNKMKTAKNIKNDKKINSPKNITTSLKNSYKVSFEYLSKVQEEISKIKNIQKEEKK